MKSRMTKIGQIIYGTQRVSATADALARWMTNEMQGRGIAVIGRPHFVQLAGLYFKENPTEDDAEPKLESLSDSMAVFDNQLKKLDQASDEDLDSHLARLRSLYVEVAALLETVGYPGNQAELLRHHSRALLS